MTVRDRLASMSIILAQKFTVGAWVLSGEVAQISDNAALARPIHSNAIRHGHNSLLVIGRYAVGRAFFPAADFLWPGLKLPGRW